MAKSEFKLQPTKSEFIFRGKVTGINKENAYRSGVGKNDREWRMIRFGVKTSPNNILYVELLGSENEFAYLWDSKNRKSVKVPFEKRHEIPAGHTILATRIGTTLGGKTTGMVEFDAVEAIRDNINDGDFVEVTGEVQFNKYVNNNGDTVRTVRYVIRTLKVIEEFDMEADDFTPVNEFYTEAVVAGVDHDKDLGKIYLNVFTVQYGDKFTDGQLVIEVSENEKFAKNVLKRLKEGDWIKANGVALNTVEITEVDEEDDSEFDEFGGRKSTAFNRQVIRTTISELRVHGISEYEPQKYDIDTDFVVDEAEDSFGGSSTNPNPFKNANTRPVTADEEEEDDVPF